MGLDEENYAKWKVRSKVLSVAAWLGIVLSIMAVVATYLVPDISNTARLAGFLFLIVNAIASPFLLYLFVRTKLEFKQAKSRCEQKKRAEITP
jgi:uncharacterized protein involved in cysteine biosynthesis